MKKIKFINVLLLMLLAVMVTGCLSDGDETVPLEYGNPKKIIIGTWRITKYNGPSSGGHFGFRQGTVLIFLSDGTFTSSPGNDKYKWFLDTYKEGNPYSGGITLDGIVYKIISLGGNDGGRGGHWIVGKPKDNGTGSDGYDEYWELEKELSAAPDDTSNTNPDTEEPSGGVGKLVSKISITKNNRTDVLQTIKFYYDNNTNRVISIECNGSQEIIPNLKNGIRLYYHINDNTMTLYHSKGNTAEARGDGTGSGYGTGKLDEMGYLVSDNLKDKDKETGTFFYNTIGNNMMTMHYYSGASGIDFLWQGGDIVCGGFTDTMREYYDYYTNIENKANINLNRLFTHTIKCSFISGNTKYEYEDVYALALSGYLGWKDKHLLSGVSSSYDKKDAVIFSYTYDSNNYPITISYNGYKCTIEYTK